jgi:hypothetical protein
MTESGNNGSPVVLLQGSGFISADELICGGKGSCLDFKAGNVTANITKITSLETENAGYPTILLDDGSQDSESHTLLSTKFKTSIRTEAMP